MDKDLKTILKEVMRERKIKTPALAAILQIPVDRIYAWYRDDSNPKGEDTLKINSWIKDPGFVGESEETSNSKGDREPSPMELLAGLTEGFKAIARTMESIESKMAQESTQAIILKAINDQEANFARSDKNQLGLASLVGELLMRDFSREAKSNPAAVQKMLQDFLQRIGPKLSPDVKESIGVDGRN